MAHTDTVTVETSHVADVARVGTAHVADARARAHAARERAATRAARTDTARTVADVAAYAVTLADDTDTLADAARMAAHVADTLPADIADTLTDAVTRWRETARTGTARETARAAGTVRRAIRDTERHAAARYGRTRHTRANVADVTDAARTVARRFGLSDTLTDTVADDVAAYIGRAATDTDTVARFRTADGPTGYAYRLARRAARSRARHAATGTGTMPRLTVSDAAITERMQAIYGTDADTVTVTDADGHTARRTLTDAERATLYRVSRFQRTERAPRFTRWLNAYGDTVPHAATGHTYGHAAPYVPHRDAAPLARGTLAERLTHTGTDADTVAAVLAARAAMAQFTERADGTRKYPVRVPWQTVTDAVTWHTDTVPHRGTVARRVAVALDTLADAVRMHGTDAGYVPTDAVPVARHVLTRAAIFPRTARARTVARGTGRTVTDGTRHADGRAVCAPIAPFAWQTVAAHVRTERATDGTITRGGCVRGGQCADGCRAIRLLPVTERQTDAATDAAIAERDAARANVCPHGHTDGCPRTCPTRAARRRGIARAYARRLTGT